MNAFAQRVLVAVVAIPALLWLMHRGGLWLDGLIAVLVIVGAAEIVLLARKLDVRFLPIVMPAGALVGAIYLWPQGGTLWAAWLTAITILPALFLIRATSPRDFSLSWVLQAGGAIWLGLGFGALGALRALDPVYGFWWLVFLFANLWTGDTAAYLVGRRLGRRPLAPSISPKKTVAGAVGQIIMSGVVGSVFALVGWLPVSKALLITSALVIGVVGQVGDLFESALKRIAGVKDSSAIIPGHGGVLDRFDSTLFAAPTLYVIVSLWPD